MKGGEIMDNEYFELLSRQELEGILKQDMLQNFLSVSWEELQEKENETLPEEEEWD